MSAEPKKEDKGSIFAQPYVDPEKNNVGEKKFFGPKSSKPNFFSSKIRPPSNVKNPGKQEIPSKKTLPPSKIPRISDDGKILKKPYKKEEARPKTPEETPKPPAKSEEPIKKRPSSSVERKRGSEKSPKEKPPGSAQSRPPSRPTPRIKTEPEPERKKPETPERYLPQPTTADKLELFQEVNEPGKDLSFFERLQQNFKSYFTSPRASAPSETAEHAVEDKSKKKFFEGGFHFR